MTDSGFERMALNVSTRDARGSHVDGDSDVRLRTSHGKYVGQDGVCGLEEVHLLFDVSRLEGLYREIGSVIEAVGV